MPVESGFSSSGDDVLLRKLKTRCKLMYATLEKNRDGPSAVPPLLDIYQSRLSKSTTTTPRITTILIFEGKSPANKIRTQDHVYACSS